MRRIFQCSNFFVKSQCFDGKLISFEHFHKFSPSNPLILTENWLFLCIFTNFFVKSYEVAYLMKCIFVPCSHKELGCCSLQDVNFILRDKLQPSTPLGMKWFFLQVKQSILWDEIQSSGCKTQFFLPAFYEIPHLHQISNGN